ncbi:ABC transporter permease [Streptomyces pactum]|uniref:ABC transporter permease n=1 Tax=Streptomyces pactum TaxID=68249 RepID=A0A1S6J4Q3_9ACTN|nr:ABC transporter permease subunit [Streptomyces pactum]AQS66749.1 ABC transporter permease [Streptomyces pactum]
MVSRSAPSFPTTARRTAPVVAAAVVLVCVPLGRYAAPHPPERTVAEPWLPPGGQHLLGTDVLGRDVLSRVLAGGTELLTVSLLAALAAVVCGTALGLAAGWSGGRTARSVRALCDLLLAVPALVLALVLATALTGATAVVVAAVLAGAPLTARVVGTQCAHLRDSGHVHAAVERGERTPAVLVHEVLPNLRRLVAADAGLRLVTALQIAAALAVLGLGPQPPAPDWALMLSENLPGAALNPLALLAPAVPLAGCAWVFAAAAGTAARTPQEAV